MSLGVDFLLLAKNETLVKATEETINGFNNDLNFISSKEIAKSLKKFAQKYPDRPKINLTVKNSLNFQNIINYDLLFIEDIFYEEFSQKENTNILNSPYSNVLFISYENFLISENHLQKDYIMRVIPKNYLLLCDEILCRLLDFYDFSLLNKMAKRAQKNTNRLSSLARSLCEFMGQQKNFWNFSFYTGSVISSLIDGFYQLAPKNQGKIIRGPSEHSLAAMALVNYLLFQKPFIIAITSGMLDEFRGSLANLIQAKAKGFIICANNRKDQWLAFQGGTSISENIEEVLTAKNISFISIELIEDIAQKLSIAFSYYLQNKGPVVILASQQVLENFGDLPQIIYNIPEIKKNIIADQNSLEKILDIINNQKIRILMQCNFLDDQERKFVYEIAEKAQIALCDSLTHPGSVRSLDAPAKQFLGSLGLYATSHNIHHFLYEGTKLRAKEEQWLFFLKSKIAQSSHPFSESELKNKLNLVQVEEDKKFNAPNVSININCNLIDFLKFINDNLNINPAVFLYRKNILEQYKDPYVSSLDNHPIMPMSVNFFMSCLRNLLTDNINNGYKYIGLYDVGRFGLSAIRELPRTNNSFSGWYGKALMGDAYMGILGLIESPENNILAFVGDGAKQMMPDIESSILEYLDNGGNFNKNLTIFFGLNGTTSLIETYQNRAKFTKSKKQMGIFNRITPDKNYIFNKIKIRHITIKEFNQDIILSLINSKPSINFINVILSHNSEGTGISTLSYDEWLTR